MVVLLARVSVKPQERDRWLGLVNTVSRPSRAEAGCNSYRAYEDVERSNEFIFVEQWQSLDALKQHFRTNHFAEFFGALPDIVAAPDVSISEVASTIALDDVLADAGVAG